MSQRYFNAADPGLRLPPGRLYWSDETMYDPKRHRPVYTFGEVSKFFFARSYIWIAQRCLYNGVDILEGMDIHRHSAKRIRHFKLHQVEMLANRFVENRMIDGERFLYAVAQVKLQAHLWGYGDKIEELSQSVRDL